MRLIDAEKMKTKIHLGNMEAMEAGIKAWIDAQPTVEPYKHGHWIDFRCSVCGEMGWSNEDAYCPSCGAKMDEVTDG